MKELDEYDLESSKGRERYLDAISEQREIRNYPKCDPDLVYTFLDATFARDLGQNRGYERFVSQIQEMISEFLEPVEKKEPDKQHIGDFTEEEVSVIETTHPLQETLRSFTLVNEEIVQGSDIANRFITTEERNEAHKSLEEFENWYRDDLEQQLAENDQGYIEGQLREYGLEEYEEIAVYNGLRTLLIRRETGEKFPSRELQVQ